MAIILSTKNYSPFQYDEFLDGTKAGDSPYIVGQLVVCKDRNDDDRQVMGIVLGCIGHETEELRTDAIGMVCYDQIRAATPADFLDESIDIQMKMRKEFEGFQVHYDWKTYKLTVSEEKLNKVFNTRFNIGKAKYVINSHDGIKTHADGSPFFEIECFSNKKKFLSAKKEMVENGFLETN